MKQVFLSVLMYSTILAMLYSSVMAFVISIPAFNLSKFSETWAYFSISGFYYYALTVVILFIVFLVIVQKYKKV